MFTYLAYFCGGLLVGILFTVLVAWVMIHLFIKVSDWKGKK